MTNKTVFIYHAAHPLKKNSSYSASNKIKITNNPPGSQTTWFQPAGSLPTRGKPRLWNQKMTRRDATWTSSFTRTQDEFLLRPRTITTRGRCRGVTSTLLIRWVHLCICKSVYLFKKKWNFKFRNTLYMKQLKKIALCCLIILIHYKLI